MEKKQKPITVMKDVYVANDGTEWETQQECERHEKELLRKEVLKSIAHMAYAKNIFPIDYEFDECETYWHQWYKVTSQDDLDKLKQIFDMPAIVVEQFPTYIYVESTDELYTRDVHAEKFEDSLAMIQGFLSHFGLKATFEPK